ncbi:hypothetical protein V9K67_21835 [Paraflavisolibacter sp. H34]|uniref:hypothetical protein n=1 Tax=Huijunlia imazamoxiresistens TaxID=3127457 RepID=UPI00301674CF
MKNERHIAGSAPGNFGDFLFNRFLQAEVADAGLYRRLVEMGYGDAVSRLFFQKNLGHTHIEISLQRELANELAGTLQPVTLTLHFHYDRQLGQSRLEKIIAERAAEDGTLLRRSFPENFTSREAVYLLGGRALLKEDLATAGGGREAWLQLDFTRREQDGNHPFLPVKEGFDLDQELKKAPFSTLLADAPEVYREMLRQGELVYFDFEMENGPIREGEKVCFVQGDYLESETITGRLVCRETGSMFADGGAIVEEVNGKAHLVSPDDLFRPAEYYIVGPDLREGRIGIYSEEGKWMAPERFIRPAPDRIDLAERICIDALQFKGTRLASMRQALQKLYVTGLDDPVYRERVTEALFRGETQNVTLAHNGISGAATLRLDGSILSFVDPDNPSRVLMRHPMEDLVDVVPQLECGSQMKDPPARTGECQQEREVARKLLQPKGQTGESQCVTGPARATEARSNGFSAQNLDFLKNSLKYMGFSESLGSQLLAALREGAPEFRLSEQRSVGGDKIDFTLHFKRGAAGGIYFFNKYDAALKKGDGTALQHTFYIEKSKGVTAKEAFNLLCGRAIYKELTNRQNEKFRAWIKLDFGHLTDSGHYRFALFNDKYGFDLEKALANHPIRELGNGEQKEKLLASLRRGNQQAVVFEKEGRPERMFIEADPQFRRVGVYDREGRKLDVKEGRKEGAVPEVGLKPAGVKR